MRILFVTANRIGDAVLSTGILSHLLERHPDAAFTVAVGPDAASIFAPMPRLNALIVIHKQRFGGHWLSLWRAVVGTRWDLVVDLRRSLLAWTLRAAARAVIPKSPPRLHRVRLLARTVGLEDDPPAPTFWATDAHRAEAAALIPDGPPVLAVGPAANWPGKQWPADRFAALIDRATGADGPLPGARVAVVAAAHERASIAPVLAAIPEVRRIDLVGRVDLPGAMACLQRCALFVGNDSGVMHMAVAAGVPTLGLFGPSHADNYAPWGPLSAWVRTEKTYDEIVGDPAYDHRTTGTVMDSLSVARAYDALRELWARASAQTPSGGAAEAPRGRRCG